MSSNTIFVILSKKLFCSDKLIVLFMATASSFVASALPLLFSFTPVSADAINDDDFVTTWRITDAADSAITIHTTGAGYNYSVDWNNDGTPDETGLTGNVTHDFGEPGDYVVRISGTFPQIYMGGGTTANARKLVDVNQWGTNVWLSMNGAFRNTGLSILSATDTPNLSQVTDMNSMFRATPQFNSNISGWNVSNVTSMAQMFQDATSFNQDLNSWNISNVTNMTAIFYNATAFNGDISDWNTFKLTNTAQIFYNASAFNGDISNWDLSNVTNMNGMFQGAASFNQDISEWNTSNVTEMSGVFQNATSFNQDISAWNTSKVTYMGGMFSNAASFNADISGWNTSNVTNMSAMFQDTATFNQDLSNWNTSKVTNMSFMFRYAAAFNGDVSGWDTSKVTTVWMMFYNATSFNRDLSSWNLSSVTNAYEFLDYTSLSPRNYDILLESWLTRMGFNKSLTVGAYNVQYCGASSARQSLIDIHGWSFRFDLQCALPGTPTNLQLTSSVSSLNLNWTKPADPKETITSYKVEYKESSETSWQEIIHPAEGESSLMITTLSPNTLYDVRVTAINGRGSGTASGTVQASTNADIPSEPLGIAATPGRETITLSWQQPLSNGGEEVTDYLIEYKVGDSGTWTAVDRDPSIDLSIVIDGLFSADEYSFRVSAVNAVGTGPASSIVTATPLLTPTEISVGGVGELDNPTTPVRLPKLPTFSGTTLPFSQVTVTIYSDPVSCSTTADSEGVWACALASALPSGNHQLFIDVVLPDASSRSYGPYSVFVEAEPIPTPTIITSSQPLRSTSTLNPIYPVSVDTEEDRNNVVEQAGETTNDDLEPNDNTQNSSPDDSNKQKVTNRLPIFVAASLFVLLVAYGVFRKRIS